MMHDWDQALSAYVDGELTASKREAVEARLARDAEYSRRYTQLLRMRKMIQEGMSEPAFHGRLMTRLEAETAQRGPRAIPYKPLMAFSAGLMLLLAGWMLWRPAPPPAAPPETPGWTVAERGEEPAQPHAPDEPALGEKDALVAVDAALGDFTYRLTGTITGANPIAVLKEESDPEPHVFRPGDEVAPGVMLQTVEREAVVLVKGDEAMRLTKADAPETARASLTGMWRAASQTDGPFGSDGSFLVEMTQTDSNVAAALYSKAPSGPSHEVLYEGVLRGDTLTLAHRWGHLERRIDGEFDSDRAVFHGKMSMHDLRDGEFIEGTDYEITLTRMDEESEAAYHAFTVAMTERQERVQALVDALRAYIGDHDGEYPASLDGLVPDYADETLLAAFDDAKALRYTGGQDDPGWRLRQGPGVTAFANFMRDRPMDERLLRYEAELMRGWGGAIPLPQLMIRVEYEEPPMTFEVMTDGRIDFIDGRVEAPEKNPGVLLAMSQNNMKQLGLVLKMFTHETPGWYLPGGWATVYPEYLVDLRILNSPVDEPGRVSYELVFPAVPFSDEDVAEIYMHVTGREEDPENPAWLGVTVSEVPMAIETVEHTDPRGRGRNVLFADGHVEFVTPERFEQIVQPYLDF